MTLEDSSFMSHIYGNLSKNRAPQMVMIVQYHSVPNKCIEQEAFSFDKNINT